jgi:hypothetical protein
VELRRRARTDPAFLRSLLARLRDPREDLRQRRLIAVVLGTFPDPVVQRSLLEALRSEANSGLKRILLLSLGAFKTDAPVDGLFDQNGPRAIVLEDGLTVIIDSKIAEETIRAEILRYLETPEESLRLAAVLALRSSSPYPEVRQGLKTAVRAEAHAETQMHAAGALADWVMRPDPPAVEREEIGLLLLDAGSKPEAAGVRLATQLGLEQTPMAPRELEKVLTFVDPQRDLGSIAWAASILSSKAGDDPAFDGRALTTLGGLIAHADAKIREQGVRASGFYTGPAALAILEKGLADPAWHVRYAACQGLTRGDALPEALRLAESASKDPDPRVAVAAEKALRELQARKKD